jgi:hypothetical protein
MQATKTCTKCHAPKPATDKFFSPDKRQRDGLGSWCRVCVCTNTIHWRAAHPAAVKTYRATHQESEHIAQAQWRASHPGARKAHNAALNAIRTGRLIRPAACERCGMPHQRLHKHHEDYTRPLDVVFLCPKCHRILHLQKKRATCRTV